MEDTSSTKEVTSQGTPFYHPTSFHEVVRAFLRCLGLQTGSHQNPISCPTEEEDGHIQQASPKQGSTPSPPSTVIDPPADPPSTTGDDDVPVISFSTPKRPGTGGGRGPQIN